MNVKHHLLAGVAMTPSERQLGRFLRAPEGHGGGDDSNSGQDNSNVSSGADDNNSQTQDNDGDDKVDLSNFWEDKDGGDDNDGDDPQEASKRLGGEIGTQIEAFKTAPFSKEIADAIAEGNLDGVNEALTKSHQETIKTAVQISAKLIGAVMDRMTKDFDRRIQGGFQQRDETAFLKQTFSQAKTEAGFPVVQRVWEQAMKNSNGDRAKATRLTRGMLAAFGGGDITTPAGDPTHGIDTAASRSLVEELLGRG